MENKEKFIAKVFNVIADDYDRMNIILTGGFFPLWQKALINSMSLQGDEKILDVCCGSGEMTLKIHQKIKNNENGEIIGIDFSENMLKKAREKAKNKNLKVEFLYQDALDLQFSDGTFDCAVNSFALRNVNDIEVVLSEIHRILKKDGKAFIMEVSKPDNKIFRFFFEIYYYHVVPLIGRLSDKGIKLEGRYSPYQWLSESLKKFPEKTTISSMFYKAGFKELEKKSYGFGGITLYIAKK